MLRLLIAKYFQEAQWLLLALGGVLVLFPWLRIWTISQFDLSAFAPVIDQLKTFERFAPIPLEQFLTYEGVIGLTFSEPVVILCILVWSISRGSDVVSGELNRGSMEMLLAQPISRGQLMLAHGLVSIAGLGLLVAATWAGVWFGIGTNAVPVQIGGLWRVPFLNWEVPLPWVEPRLIMRPLSELVDSVTFLPASVNLFSFGFFVWTLAVRFSSIDHFRWRTIGCVLAVYVGQFLMFLLSRADRRFDWLKYFTFFSAYEPDRIVQLSVRYPAERWQVVLQETQGVAEPAAALGPMGYSLILLLLGILLYIWSWLHFVRRDLPAPI
jgi:ABC-2 type transport system permease protein